MLPIRRSDIQFCNLTYCCLPLVIDPWDEGRVHMHVLKFGFQQPWLDGVESAGEVEEHDVDSGVGSIQGGVGFLQQVDYCIINPNMGLICKL